MGNSHPNIAPYSVYKTKDHEYIVIGVATDGQFEKLCSILGIDSSDHRFKTNRDRCENRDQLNALIQDTLETKWEKNQLIEEMAKLSIPFSEILSVKQLFEQPEVVSGMNLTTKITSQKYQGDRENKELEFPRNPIHYSKSSVADVSEPPLLGEDTDSILKQLLGYSDSQIS